MSDRVYLFQHQNYHALKRACLRRAALFQDPFFLASAQSLFYKRAPPPGLTWKRPRELCRDPRLFVDGISTRDLHQGSLGNCWMVAAISCLATEPSLWKKVIPDHMEQEWNPKHPYLYAGIFHFRFWRMGQWMDVVVDDRLPVSEDGTLLFCRSASPREFWSALLEKAYAKLNGCYEALEGGNTAEALVDFTGGVSELLSLDQEALSQHAEQRRALFQMLAKAHSRKALITCSIRSVLDCGLVKGHAYSVTEIRKIRLGETLLGICGTSRIYMVRMRNPWGMANWTGAWSQGSLQWQRTERSEREKMGLVVRDVGEFWMEFGDFCHYFTDMVVCRLVKRSLLWTRHRWGEECLLGEWTHREMDRRSRCGGCSNFRETFLHNPQFMFEVGKEENEVLICLQQEDRRIKRKEGSGENLPIGFEVLKVEVNRTCRVQRFGEQAASSVYMDSRSVALRVTLGPGRYTVVPTTFQPGVNGRFLLRLFSHTDMKLRELKEDLPVPSLWWCCGPQLCAVTTIHLHRASMLSQSKQPAPDVYAVIRCEEETIRTRVFKKDGSPEFNTKVIFYRRRPYTKISITVRCLPFDSFLGGAHLQIGDSENERSRVVDLRGGQSCGYIYIETSSSQCLTDL
uniref:Calpain catalytic domain-containing protein n=1 Tax=Electrophorus electricus TaxID=8005 RepID=A0A4W4DNT7_ELEEL